MSTATRPDPRPPQAPAGPATASRLLLFGLPVLALFACVWVTRVFIAVDVVTQVLHMTGLRSIAAVAVVGAMLPSLPLGLAYGLLRPRPVAASAVCVALGACVLELAFASLTVPWWSFFTWWVLPLECAIVLFIFPLASMLGARCAPRADARLRRRAGAAIFGVLTLCAVVWPLLQGCVRNGSCGSA
jgi:hypothetical protein